MTKLTGFRNAKAVPTVGTSGHVISIKVKGQSQVSDLEKLRKLLNTVCPVNKNVPTKMLKSSFVKTCLQFRKIAEKDKGRKNKFTVTTSTGFKSSNRGSCLKCKRGEKIAKGLPFTPPTNMVFEELEDIPGRKQLVFKVKKKIKYKPKAKPKPKLPPKLKGLSEEDVITIRKLYDTGSKLSVIHKRFPQVGREAVSRAANRLTFKEL